MINKTACAPLRNDYETLCKLYNPTTGHVFLEECFPLCNELMTKISKRKDGDIVLINGETGEVLRIKERRCI